MTIEVQLFAHLRWDRFRKKSFELPDGLTAGQAIQEIGIPAKDVALIMINGKDALSDAALNNGDMVALFPAVAGG